MNHWPGTDRLSQGNGSRLCCASSALAYIVVIALFSSHLQLTVTLRYQLPFLVISTPGYFPCTGGGRAHSHPDWNISPKSPTTHPTWLPFVWSAVSPPLYSWGASMKTPPTFCHVGNKSASFILIFSTLSAAPLFGYIVCPLSRHGEVWSPPSLRQQGNAFRNHRILLIVHKHMILPRL